MSTRRLLYAAAALTALAVAGCGSSRMNFTGEHRQAPPLNMSVFVSDSHVLVSPKQAGAGPVTFNVTNQASRTESVTITRGGGQAVASTGPINPNSTAQVTVDFTRGDYRLATQQITASGASASRSTTLRIGAARQGGDSALLQP